jgi:putative ABC transport system permease protein
MTLPAVRLLRLCVRDLRGSARRLWVLCACLCLGVALIAASAGLHRQVGDALLSDARALLGGDLEVRSRALLSEEVVAWMNRRGKVSLLVELRTMLGTDDGRVQLVELQVTDDAYPLYGTVALSPPLTLRETLARRDGIWGAAFDPALARRLGAEVGDIVRIGALRLELRARVDRQPDRSLRADWRGPPLMIAAGALDASGLVQPGSRIAYRYRVRTREDLEAWQGALTRAFPGADFEIRSFERRSARVAEVLGQVGSGLLLVGFSALFIGGLGVFNSVNGYLQGKLATLATLRALGLRDGHLAGVYLAQVLLVACAASVAGALAGVAMAAAGAAVVAGRLPLGSAGSSFAGPATLALAFGVLTALTFALPALGRALSVSPASLFRGIDAEASRTPRGWWLATGASAALIASLVLLAMPQAVFGLGFVLVVSILLALLEGMVRGLRVLSGWLVAHAALEKRFALRLALATLHRPGSPLRVSLISLGTALTLLVTCSLVVGSLLRVLDETIPERAPALVFHDIPAGEVEAFRALVAESPSLQRLDLAPLVLGRLAAVNGEPLAASSDLQRALEARDEHKLSHRAGNFDNVRVERGAWWPEGYRGRPLVAMEDREAAQIGLEVGDILRFEIFGEAVEAELVAIYGQRRFEARFWLEGIFSDAVLDPYVTRYVGTAHMDSEDAETARERIATAMPNVITVHTGEILDEARGLLARASAGLTVVAGVTLVASLLVLASAMAGSRVRQVYDATILYTVGARPSVIRASLWLEHAFLAALVSAFSLALGGSIAIAFLRLRLALDTAAPWALGVSVAAVVSVASLALGARWLTAQLRLSPALLLRAG